MRAHFIAAFLQLGAGIAEPFLTAPHLGDWLAVITASVSRTIGTLADIGFEVRIIGLRVVPHQTTVNASQIAFHHALLFLPAHIAVKPLVRFLALFGEAISESAITLDIPADIAAVPVPIFDEAHIGAAVPAVPYLSRVFAHIVALLLKSAWLELWSEATPAG